MNIKFAREGQEIGEHAEEAVPALIQSNTLRATDYFWHEGLPEWTPVASRWTIPKGEPAPVLKVPPSPEESLVEYRILSQRDQLFSGRFDSATITSVLNQLALSGWRVVSVTSAGINSLLGGNRDEILIFLERKRVRK